MQKKLDPGAKWFFVLKTFYSLIFVGIFIIIWGMSFLTSIFFKNVNFLSSIVIVIVIYFVIAIIISLIYSSLAYERWFYEFTPSNLKIESGIIWKKYSNIPYERVQNVDITRGVIARIFGFSTVNIQTAGYSYNNRRGWSEGYIPAVTMEEAEQIRNFLMKRISKSKQGESGL